MSAAPLDDPLRATAEPAPLAARSASPAAVAPSARVPKPRPGRNPRLVEWSGRSAWIIGGSSGIGRALASALHFRGARVAVSARRGPALDAFAAEHPGAVALPLDVEDPASITAAMAALTASHGTPEAVIYCAGHYRAQRATAFDLAEMLRHERINYLGVLHVLDAVLPGLLAAGRGHLGLVGSVAGYRGLPQSLAYGPTKAALINLAETLHLDLAPRGVGVSLINPGFVRTALTAQNEFSMPALISPEDAALRILEGLAQGRFEMHFPKRFTLPMKALRLLPFGLYERVVRRMTGL